MTSVVCPIKVNVVVITIELVLLDASMSLIVDRDCCIVCCVRTGLGSRSVDDRKTVQLASRLVDNGLCAIIELVKSLALGDHDEVAPPRGVVLLSRKEFIGVDPTLGMGVVHSRSYMHSCVVAGLITC